MKREMLIKYFSWIVKGPFYFPWNVIDPPFYHPQQPLTTTEDPGLKYYPIPPPPFKTYGPFLWVPRKDNLLKLINKSLYKRQIIPLLDSLRRNWPILETM